MAKLIEICEPTAADREQIVRILNMIYSKSGAPELKPFVAGTGDAGSRLDYCIEKKLGAIAKIGKRVVGICGWRFFRGLPVTGDPVCAEMILLYVAPEARRRGVATRLCARYAMACRQAELKNPRIAVLPTPESEAFFAKLGFRERQRVYQID